MRVIVSAGGTGGHLYPALALVEYIESKNLDAEFLFVGTTDRLESQIVPAKGYQYRGLNVKGFVGNPIQKVKNGLIFLMSLKKSKRILKEFQPDVVIGFGGYPSASIVLAASQLGIKTMIHEQNSIIGLTNKILIKHVDKIICCYKSAYELFPAAKTKLLGNPRASVVSHQVLKDIHELYGIDAHKKTVVIVMGSLGSASINKVMKEALLSMQYDNYDVIYVTGKNYYDEMKRELSGISNQIHLVSYIDDLPSLIHSCDLLVSRAGATTLAEITALSCASLLIPSPYVVANHQEYNAKELVDHQAAEWILEKDLTAELFVSRVRDLINNEDKLDLLKEQAGLLGKPHACEDIYDEMIDLIERN